MGRFAVVSLVVTFPFVASSTQGGRDSYQYLSVRGKELVAPLVENDPVAPLVGNDPAQVYNSWRQSERTTFEAIVHALEALQIDHLIERVDAIWGVSESSDGRDQYRLSVTLTPGAVEEIRDNEDFDEKRFGGHVKLPNGHVVGRLVVPPFSFLTAAGQTDTVRQNRPRGSSRASVQISWLESDERTADIDIDYLSIWRGNHGKPLNSDVRFGSHHETHEQTFGRLTNWWSNGGP